MISGGALCPVCNRVSGQRRKEGQKNTVVMMTTKFSMLLPVWQQLKRVNHTYVGGFSTFCVYGLDFGMNQYCENSRYSMNNATTNNSINNNRNNNSLPKASSPVTHVHQGSDELLSKVTRYDRDDVLSVILQRLEGFPEPNSPL